MGFRSTTRSVYDRVRENLVRSKREPLRQVVDCSINDAVANHWHLRGVVPAIAPLALFGGLALREFALTLLFGLVLATSFVSSPRRPPQHRRAPPAPARRRPPILPAQR